MTVDWIPEEGDDVSNTQTIDPDTMAAIEADHAIGKTLLEQLASFVNWMERTGLGIVEYGEHGTVPRPGLGVLADYAPSLYSSSTAASWDLRASVDSLAAATAYAGQIAEQMRDARVRRETPEEPPTVDFDQLPY